MIIAALYSETQSFLELVMLTKAPSAVQIKDVLQLKLTEESGIKQVDVVSGFRARLVLLSSL